MKIKTSELIDASLDWAVWTAAGGAAAYPKTASGPAFLKLWKGNTAKYVHPSTDWAQGGPIIERERISIRQWTNVPIVHAYMPHDDAPWASDGTSPLIAAMRCFVTSKLGDEVDIPEELLK